MAAAPAASQLDLACDAGISTRHLSFVETGRAHPSRDMLLHLSEQLDVPVRERNVLLVAAGYAPIFPERPLADPALTAARAAIDLVLERQKPYPAFALDRHWGIVASNAALPDMYDGVTPDLLEPPVNAMRLSLHPQGLASKIVNLAEWRAHLLHRLRHQVEITADRTLMDLLREVNDYPAPAGKQAQVTNVEHDIAIPFRIRTSFRRAVLFQHDDGVRHAGRRDAVRTGARIILPGRRRHCRGRAAHGSQRPVVPIETAFLYLPRNRFRSSHEQDWCTADKRPVSQYEEKSNGECQRNRRPLSRGLE